MSSESSSTDIILRENYVLRTRVCFGRFTHLPEITQISWRRFRMGIMINACSAKPHTSLALHPRYIIPARPDEFFRFTVVSYLWNNNVKNRDAPLFEPNLYNSFLVTSPEWNIFHSTHWINKFSFRYVIRKKLRSLIRQIFMAFWKWKMYISFYKFENFNYTESSTYRNNVMWII